MQLSLVAHSGQLCSVDIILHILENIKKIAMTSKPRCYYVVLKISHWEDPVGPRSLIQRSPRIIP